jgi:hypothetical protein
MMLPFVLLPGAYLAGHCLTRLVAPRTESRDSALAAFPAGAAVYTLVLFCLNQGGGVLLTRPVLLATLAALCALFAAGAALRRSPAAGPATFREPAEPLSGLAAAEFALLVVLLSVLAVAGTLAPITHWDINSEYYPLQREILRGETLPLAVTPSSAEATRAFPAGYTLLAAAGHILEGRMSHVWARFLSPLYAFLLLGFLYRMGRRHLTLTKEVALGAVLLCAALPIFSNYMTVPTSTICFCFYALAGIYFLLEYYRTQGWGALLLAGLFLGFSYWISYTGAVLIPCVFLTIIVCAAASRFSRGGELSALRFHLPRLFGLILIVGAVAAPHLARNWIRFGNPLYPALYQVFGGVWIDDWSISHLIVPLMPSSGFYLRPRWEIFHEGFLINLLFALSLLSWPWYRKPLSLFLGLFCIFYTAFYLKFFTWPREYGISIKLLLPALIPACLFAGERLSRILSGRLPAWQWAAILCLIPVWAAVMLGDYAMLPSARSLLPLRHPLSLLKAARAFFFDLDELLIWAGIAGCLAGGLARNAAARRSFGALLLLSLAARPFTENVSLLADHASA